MTSLSQVRFHNGGYCLQFARMAGADSWRPRKFQAVFVSFLHPKHGLCLIDTGYGPAVREANRSIAGRMLSLLLPIPRRQVFDASDYPQQPHRIHPDEVNLIFVSHFHADHIGGLRLFPRARYVYREASYQTLQQASWREQLTHGFFPALMPDGWMKQGEPLREHQFTMGGGWMDETPTYDYFQDGSLIMVDLPGHAIGHTGYLLRTADQGRIFYVVDAMWDAEAWASNRTLPWLSRHVAHDSAAYLRTQQQLRSLAARFQGSLLACHCPLTQRHVIQPAH